MSKKNIATSQNEESNPLKIDKVEKRISKEKKKTLGLIKKWLSSIQMFYELLKQEQQDQQDRACRDQEEEFQIVEADEQFAQSVKSLVIEPFGKRLNQDLIELFQDLELPEKFLQDLKLAQQHSPRRSSRKPQTPVKLTKEVIPLSIGS